MPAYLNRPHLDPETPVRRYMCLGELEDVLRSRRLQMTRVDRFDDPFEGSVPKQQIDDQVVIFGGANLMQMQLEVLAAHYPGMDRPPRPRRDSWDKVTIRRRAATRSAHASCWTHGHESEAMWRLYCNDGAPGQGVALRTTLSRLEQSLVAHDLYVSPVIYRLYHEGPAFTNDIDPFMHKRQGFQCENEVRLLRYNQEHQLALASATIGPEGYMEPAPMPAELAERIYLDDWNPLDIAAAIGISPYAIEAYEQGLRESLHEIAPAELIGLSVLSARRYAPLF